MTTEHINVLLLQIPTNNGSLGLSEGIPLYLLVMLRMSSLLLLNACFS